MLNLTYIFSGERDRAGGEVRLPSAARLPPSPEEEEAQPQVQGDEEGQEISTRVPGNATEKGHLGLGLGEPATSTHTEVSQSQKCYSS